MGDSILVKNTRDPLGGLTRSEFESRLSKALEGRAEEVWLFGSYVRGEFGPESDVDVILVAPTVEPFPLRSRRFADLLDIGPRLDILVYTSQELRSLVDDPTDGFWHQVAAHMRRLNLQRYPS